MVEEWHKLGAEKTCDIDVGSGFPNLDRVRDDGKAAAVMSATVFFVYGTAIVIQAIWNNRLAERL
jgi:hypothetical protein